MTCLVLCAKCQMAPLSTPRSPTPAYRQDSVLTRRPFLFEVFRDARTFLAWQRASCPGGLTAQLKSENLTVVPSTADGFRAPVSALRSLDGKENVSIHTFTFSEHSCVRLVRCLPDSIVRGRWNP